MQRYCVTTIAILSIGLLRLACVQHTLARMQSSWNELFDIWFVSCSDIFIVLNHSYFNKYSIWCCAFVFTLWSSTSCGSGLITDCAYLAMQYRWWCYRLTKHLMLCYHPWKCWFFANFRFSANILKTKGDI